MQRQKRTKITLGLVFLALLLSYGLLAHPTSAVKPGTMLTNTPEYLYLPVMRKGPLPFPSPPPSQPSPTATPGTQPRPTAPPPPTATPSNPVRP